MTSLFRNGSLGVALLVCLVISEAACGCVERSDPNYETAKQTDSSTFSDFLSSVGCSIQSGARRVKDGVEGGYNYLKDKISTAVDDTKSRDHRPSPENGGDAVIEGESDIYKHIRESVPLAPTPTPSVTGISLDDRNAIAGPVSCPPETRYVPETKKCEKVFEDFE